MRSELDKKRYGAKIESPPPLADVREVSLM